MTCLSGVTYRFKRYMAKGRVGFYNSNYYFNLLKHLTWVPASYPAKDITEENEKHRKDKGKYLVDPRFDEEDEKENKKKRIKYLSNATEITIHNYAFSLILNEKKYVAYTVSALTPSKGKYEEGAWEGGLIYIVFNNICKIYEPKITQSDEKNIQGQKASYVFASNIHKPVDLGYSQAKIVSGYYRTFLKVWEGGKLVHDFHGGIDISAKEGTPALAMYKTKFISSTRDPNPGIKKGAGHSVIMQILEGKYKNYFLTYMHLQKYENHEPGKKFEPGERVGFVGNTGKSDGAHLHIEIRKKRQSIRDDYINLNELFVEKNWYEIDPDTNKGQPHNNSTPPHPLSYKLINTPDGTDYVF